MDMNLLEDKELHAKRFEIVKHMADEWLAKGTLIWLEMYVILAKK